MSIPRWQKQTTKLVLVLGITGLISGGLLALAFGWLDPIIQQRQKEQEISVGLKGIYPDADRFEEVDIEQIPGGVDGPVYRVFDQSDKVLGLYFSGSGPEPGYGGPIRVAVGVDEANGQILGVRILSHSETAGIGTKVEDESFLSQFIGRSATASSAGLNTISGATRSSKAVISGVTNMARGVMTALAGGTAGSVPAEVYLIYPEAASLSPMQIEAPVEVDGEIYEVYSDSGQTLGLWYKASVKGFKEGIVMAVGLNPQTTSLVGVKVLSHNETKDIGDKIDDPAFTDQFVGKSLSDQFKPGSDVDAYSGATMSSTGVYKGVSEISRKILGAMGIEVEVKVSAAMVKAPEPDYADRVKALFDGEVTFNPGSIWEIKDETGKLFVCTVTRQEGDGGKIDVLVVVDPAAKKVAAVDILKHYETFGADITSQGFRSQFVGKGPNDKYVVGEDIDGITMATISSQAVSDAVKNAIQIVLSLY
jgi:electron transport complex protein RnfG